MQDAVKAEADRIIERLKEDLRKAGIDYAAMDRNDPASIKEADSIQINLRGVPAAKAGDLRTLVGDRYPSWILTPVSSTDYRLNMKPTELIGLKNQTMERTKQTIESRINSLGVGRDHHPAARPRRGRVRDAGPAARRGRPGAREADHADGGHAGALARSRTAPSPARTDARAKNGGVLPLDTKLVRGIGARRARAARPGTC